MNEEKSKAVAIQEEATMGEAPTAEGIASVEDRIPSKETAGKAESPKRVPEFLEPYLRRYSGEKVFHVTSDRQVFRGKNYHLARLHQAGLGQGELKTYNI